MTVQSRARAAATALCLALLLGAPLLVLRVDAADHKEAPIVRLAEAIDINDVYVFQPGGATGTATPVILAMTVNPFVAPGTNTNAFFDPGIRYRFNIDRTGDFVEDVVYEVRFGSIASNVQTITVNGVSAGNTTALSVSDTAVPAVVNTFTLNGQSHKIFAGLREDPFFFDLVGFLRFSATGTGFPRTSPPDSFTGVNISAIVIEAPVAALQDGGGSAIFNVWATTVR
jgi:hypothetical protein